MEDLLLQMQNQNIANQAGNLFDQRQRNLVNQAAMDVFSTGFDNRNTGIMQQAPYETFSSLPSNLGVVNQPNEETEEYEVDQFGYRKEPNKLGGILDLLAGIAIPGYGIFKNVAQGGFEGLRGLNQRIRQSDFGQAKTLMDYLDMRQYGGAQGRRDAAARNMAQARGITKSLASRPSSDSGGYQQGPGGSGAQSTGASRSQQQAGPGFSGSGSAAEMGSF